MNRYKHAMTLLIYTVCVMLLLASCSVEKNPSDAAASTVSTTMTDSNDTASAQVLDMPDKIELNREVYEGAQQWSIVPLDSNTLQMTDDLGVVTTVKLESEQIRQLNALYNSVTDYTNIIPFEYPDTVFYCGETTTVFAPY